MNFRYIEALKEIQHLVTNAILRGDEDIAVETFKMIAELSNAAIDGAAGVRALPGCPSLMPAKVIPHDEPAAEVPRTEEEKQKQREIEHFSFCNGVFPIHTVRTPSGSMGKCEINGRKFSFSSVDASGPDDHACTVRIWDGGNQIAFMTVLRGRSIAEPMAMGAFKAYVKQISGSKKFHGRGGFLKQALKRWQEAQEKGQE